MFAAAFLRSQTTFIPLYAFYMYLSTFVLKFCFKVFSVRIQGLLNSFIYCSFHKSHPPSPFNCSEVLFKNVSVSVLRVRKKSKAPCLRQAGIVHSVNTHPLFPGCFKIFKRCNRGMPSTRAQAKGLRVDTERRFLPRFKNRGLAPSNVSTENQVFGFLLEESKESKG